MDKRTERNIARRIVRAVARELEDAGFRQTKPTFVIRPGDIVTPFFHFHKFTFGPYFRIHLGVRVMNDTVVALALNGEDSPLRPEGQQALSNALPGRFNVQAIALSESLLGLRSGKNTAT